MGQADRVGASHDALPVVHASYRDPQDDFFCLRFQVWYPSIDCAVRTKYRTCPGCLQCEQGRFNLKRHAATLARAARTRPFPPTLR